MPGPAHPRSRRVEVLLLLELLAQLRDDLLQPRNLLALLLPGRLVRDLLCARRIHEAAQCLLCVPGRRRQVHEHERLRVTTERVAHELRELVVPVRHGLGVRRQGLGCERSVKIK